MKGLSGLRKREERMFYIFISPWLIGFLAFSIMPILASLGFSFTEYNFFKPPKFVGLANYIRLLTGDLFLTSLGNTLFMVVFGVPSWIAVALGLSLLVNKEIWGIRGFRTIFYLPAVMSGPAVSILWIYIFLPNFGLLASLLSLVNVRSPFWLGDPRLVKPAFIIMGTWSAGGSIPLFLAALKNVPKELYEAAEMDGAGMVPKFRRSAL
ncbi:MAG: sugar ABC transporter permease, partial [candidate division WOR-3 bacterium]